MASGIETTHLDITWNDSYNNPQGGNETSVWETNKPYFDSVFLGHIPCYNNQDVTLTFKGFCHQMHDVKAQVTTNGRNSPQYFLHRKNYSRNGYCKFIVRVMIRNAQKSKHAGEWSLRVYNYYSDGGGAPVVSRRTLIFT